MPRPPWSASEGRQVSATTVDGVLLRGIHLPLPGARRTFVVVHSMTNHISVPFTRRVLRALASRGTVVALDLRGHGRSRGRSTVGRNEVFDVDVAITLARRLAEAPVVVVGFSLGGAVALRHAGAVRHDDQLSAIPDAVVSVSAPARWFLRDTTSMRRVQWLLEHPSGRIVGPRIGIRLGGPWHELPTTPLEAAAGIAPTPLLLVHGSADRYYDSDQAIALHRAAPGSELWLIEGMGHAESGVGADVLNRIADWSERSVER